MQALVVDCAFTPSVASLPPSLPCMQSATFKRAFQEFAKRRGQLRENFIYEFDGESPPSPRRCGALDFACSPLVASLV